MRSLKLNFNIVHKTMALGGVLIILIQVLWIAQTQAQVAVVGMGILINQLGVWGLASRFLGPKRIFLKLRAEVDDFLYLVRELNSHALSGETMGVEATKTAMHQSVDRMATFAGVATGPRGEGSRSGE